MIADLIEMAKANPVLVAGLGTVAFGSLMYIVKGIPVWVWSTLKRLATIEVNLTSESGLYREIIDLLSRHRIGLFARLYTTDFNGNVVAGYGTSIAMWRGVPVVFTREIVEKNFRLDEKVGITIYSRRLSVLGEIIAAARIPPSTQTINVYQYSGYFGAAAKKRKRGLDTVFANGRTIADIVERIAWFQANEDWYLRRGIPYKLVVLLHGPPGTGKTSMVFSLASHFNKALCAIASVDHLDRDLVTAPDNAFMLVEDIDMLAVSREEDEPAAPAAPGRPSPPPAKTAQQLSALHVLINALDGVATPHGLIMFITTNYKDRLDPALIRDGRIDLDVEVGRLDRAAAAQMFAAFYGPENAHQMGAGYEPRTGAELQSIFSDEADPAAAARRLQMRRAA